MIFTDPPYNVPVEGHVSGLGKVRHREFAMASGEMTSDQFGSFLEAVLAHMGAHSTDGAISFCFISHAVSHFTSSWRASSRPEMSLSLIHI